MGHLPTPHRCNRPPARAGGFTLLELMMVVAVLAVLLGLSIGMLSRTDPSRAADSMLAGELRSAQFTARAEGLPTEVWIRRSHDGEPATVQSRLLVPIVAFHFEPGEPVLDDRLRATVAGTDVPQGRFGHARQPREGERAPLLRWPMAPELLALREGYVVRFDLKLTRRAAAAVLHLGQAVELHLDDEGRLRARFRSHAADGSIRLTTAAAPLPLPVATWCSIDVAWDGTAAWLSVDGREVARAAAEGAPVQERDDLFEIAPADSPVPGIVDEVRLLVFRLAPPQQLPIELVPERDQVIRYDARGETRDPTAVTFVKPEDKP